MRRNPLLRRLALLGAAAILVTALPPPNAAYAAHGTRLRKGWYYDWAWQGYYQLYRVKCQRGRTYTIHVVPETDVDDPDLYVGTSDPRGTNRWWCSPYNYLWYSARGEGKKDKVTFRAGYTGMHYFCVYAYAPEWTGWYVRVKKRW
ncbi:MAG TPA: hypothetical protein QGH10_00905 [Armatimonadota bacterium]|nr:hypothetical protein [Armatimonadota bacterium]